MKKRILVKRKEFEGRNVEFLYHLFENDGDPTPALYRISSEKLINWINDHPEDENMFEVYDLDGTLTRVITVEPYMKYLDSGGVEIVEPYLKSPSNDGHGDNLDSLPLYTDENY